MDPLKRYPPTTLDDWDLGLLRRLVTTSAGENDTFDFKKHLDGDGRNIRKAACSFANSDGGFLVFGVLDKGEGESRIAGVTHSREFLADLQRLLAPIEPSLHFAVRDPAIVLHDDRTIPVVHFPRGVRGPHWDPQARTFWRRGKGTAVHMSHEEVRLAFSNHAEKVGRVRLVYLSLIDNWTRLEDIVQPESGNGPLPLTVLDLTLIRAGMGDIQTLLPDLVEPLMRLVRDLDTIATRCAHMSMAANAPMDLRRSIASQHKSDMRFEMRQLYDRVNWLLLELVKRLGFEKIKPRGAFEVPPLTPAWWL